MGNNHNENDKSPQIPGLYLLSAVDVFKYLSSDNYSNLEIDYNKVIYNYP